MNIEEKRRVSDAVIYIISCCLGGKKVDRELISHVQLGDIYSTAVKHSLDAIVTTALEDIGIFSKKASELKMNSVRKNMMFDAEREEILAEFESRGIKHMPLKGVVMKELYPAVGLRQMADNDILFDPEFRKEVRDIMTARGYESEHYEKSNHDVYTKKPLYNFEMHVSLFSEGSELDNFLDYYSDGFKMAKKDNNSSFGYHLDDNDYYVYVRSHEYKHYINSGTGLRSLVDVFVYLKAKGDSLDFNYISRECEKLGITEFESETRALAQKVFDPAAAEELVRSDLSLCEPPLSADERELLDSYIDSATYGTREKFVVHKLEREKKKNKRTTFGVKASYLCSLIFPPLSYYESVKPGVSGKKYLIPFLWLKRAFVILFTRPKKAVRDIARVVKAKVKK